MKKRSLACIIFACVILAQLGLPGWLIARHELTLARGEPVKFKVRPVDPYDPFRGRYVNLELEQTTAPLPEGYRPERGTKVYVPIKLGRDGFAKLGHARPEPPSGGPYIKCRVRATDGNRARLDMPLSRYYMEGRLAQPAQTATRQRAMDGDVWVQARLWRGHAVIVQLYVGDTTIRQYLQQRNEHTRGAEAPALPGA